MGLTLHQWVISLLSLPITLLAFTQNTATESAAQPAFKKKILPVWCLSNGQFPKPNESGRVTLNLAVWVQNGCRGITGSWKIIPILLALLFHEQHWELGLFPAGGRDKSTFHNCRWFSSMKHQGGMLLNKTYVYLFIFFIYFNVTWLHVIDMLPASAGSLKVTHQKHTFGVA